MTIDLDQLETTAKAATPGPWKEWHAAGYPYIVQTNMEGMVDVISECRMQKNSVYIAAVSPDVVLELVKELRRVKAERDWLANTLADYCSHTTGDEQANCGIMPCPKREINVCCLDTEKCDWLTVVNNTLNI